MGPRCDRSNHRRAFTLIEVLVVIAIISVLLALLLSAVQRTREAAARSACQNQVKQLALALHQYHDSFTRFPPGHRSLTNPDMMPYSGWTLDVLPFIEQPALYNGARAAYLQQPIPFAQPLHPGLDVVVKTFTCPSDPRVATSQVSTVTKIPVAFTSFMGAAGLNGLTLDGVLFRDSRVRFADITDGTSNTLLLGERPPSADLQFGWWYAGTGQAPTGSADMTLGARELNQLPVVSGSPCGPGAWPFVASRFDDPCGMFHFWSPHSGGANFAFSDGSVKFLPYSANAVLPALASRAGGEVVSPPE